MQEEGWTALTVAATTGNAEIVQLILDRGADVKARNTVSFDNAVAEHIYELLNSIALLLCDFQDGFCPLDLAVEHNHCEVARLLLKYGADPNSRNEKAVALFLAAKARGELPAQRGAHAPLLRAVARGYAEITKALLDAGADPEMYDEVSDRDCRVQC
jgi:ankyrin repeat protein